MYINGLGAISPQNTHSGEFPFELKEYKETRLSCLEPEYKEYISPRTSRRMSRIVKMGVTAALMAMKGENASTPEAIIAGSGLGCMKDTEKFLTAISENDEKFLNPAPFIHSTHNTISSQIALLLQCNGYNQTYVHGPFSFESALLDGMMLIREGTFSSILVGGVDEMTSNLFAITKRFGHWKPSPISNLKLLKSQSNGTMAGEGASFFKLEKEQNANSFARVVDIDTAFGTLTENDLEKRINRFLETNKLTVDKLELCFMGKNGDKRIDRLYSGLLTRMFKNCPIGAYKHLCGEYHTSSAFALWLAANILKKQHLPDFVMTSDKIPGSIQTALIVNRYQADYLSLMLLQAC